MECKLINSLLFRIIPPPFDCWTKNKTPKKGPHFKSELEITPSPVIYLFQSIYNMETMIQSFSPSRVHPPLLSCSRVQGPGSSVKSLQHDGWVILNIYQFCQVRLTCERSHLSPDWCRWTHEQPKCWCSGGLQDVGQTHDKLRPSRRRVTTGQSSSAWGQGDTERVRVHHGHHGLAEDKLDDVHQSSVGPHSSRMTVPSSLPPAVLVAVRTCKDSICQLSTSLHYHHTNLPTAISESETAD